MQYLVSVIDDTAGLATPDEMAAIDAFNAREHALGFGCIPPRTFGDTQWESTPSGRP